MNRPWRAALATGAAVTASIGLLAAPGAQASPARPVTSDVVPVVRVNQVGYAPGDPKVAYAMLPKAVAAVHFAVRGRHGVVMRGTARHDLGRWNSQYGAVYRLAFSGVHRRGRYRVTVATHHPARSPQFRIAPRSVLYDRLVRHGVRYFTSERDGANVKHSVLDREPANLTDRHAQVYAAPRYDSDDELVGGLRRIGGPVDVAGGWFDAGGGYEKFGYTAAYSDGLMAMAARQDAGHDRALRREARFGLRWLTRLWNPRKKVMYVQVGIGAGGDGIAGDYDYWFLPQHEDRLGAAKGDSDYYVEYRPVFEAAPPGRRVDPDLAGRYAAAYALGAQLAARRHPRRARHLLHLARTVYAQARTHHVGALLTAYPHDFYPGTQWKSDMLWGATEMALADHALHLSRRRDRSDLRHAGHWARAYVAQGHPAGSDTLNLYDDGAVAEADLIQAQRDLGGHDAVPAHVLLHDMAVQLELGEHYAASNPFSAGLVLGDGDATPHAFGLYVTEALFRHYGGGSRFAGFAQQQLNFVLGANPWGTSFVVGAGTTFPHCMQSEIANLSGSLDGTGRIQLGAVGDGPSAPDNFVGLGTVDGMRACSAGHFGAFDNAHAAYEDNVVAWPSVEPADDYTMNSIMAFALAGGRRQAPSSNRSTVTKS